jgi:hypothetical protein
MHAREAARPRGKRVRLVDGQQHVVARAGGAQRGEKAWLRQHHAGVGHHRLREHAGDVAAIERSLDRIDVVEVDDHGGHGRIMHATHLAGPRQCRPAFPHHGQGLLHRAVIAAVEHQHARPARDHARQAQHGAVGIRGRLRELPPGQAEQRSQAFSHLRHLRRRQHGGEPARRLRGDGRRHGRRGMPEHRAGIAQAEIHVAMPVDIGQLRITRFRDVQRHRQGPVAHPVHGHTGREMPGRVAREFRGAWPRGKIGQALTLDQGRERRADHGAGGVFSMGLTPVLPVRGGGTTTPSVTIIFIASSTLMSMGTTSDCRTIRL